MSWLACSMFVVRHNAADVSTHVRSMLLTYARMHATQQYVQHAVMNVYTWRLMYERPRQEESCHSGKLQELLSMEHVASSYQDRHVLRRFAFMKDHGGMLGW